jgi:iron complex outermembrane receptor protein
MLTTNIGGLGRADVDIFPVQRAERRRFCAVTTTTLFAGMALAPGPALGQPAAPPAVSAKAAKVPDEQNAADIIVTAQRRDTRLQETPVAVSAISGTTIERERVLSIADVSTRVPSITFQRVNNSESFISIRGTTIGNDAAGIDQGVSVFIDEVPTTGFGDDNPNLYDLQSVEVLRGPQGTLFGRNVTGGAVLIRTLPPSFTPSARATVTYGSNNLMELQGFGTGPIVDGKLAAKVAVDLRRRDNFLTNVTLHNKTYGENVGSIRGQLLWTPASNVKVTLGGDYLDDTGAGKAQWILGNFQPSLFPTLVYSPDATNQGANSTTDRKVGGLLGRVEAELPFGTLTSVAGYRSVKDTTFYSTSGDPFNSILSTTVARDTQFSQEMRLASPTDQRLTWVVGGFYLHANRSYSLVRAVTTVPGTRLNFLGRLGIPSVRMYASPFVASQFQHVTLDSEAVFGEATFALLPTLKFTAGGRYSNERKSGHTEISDTSGFNPALNTGPYAKTFSAFTPKALLSFQPSRHFLAYVSATNGFESGGFDTNATTVAGLRSPYLPEHVWSYEAGAKTSFFGNRLIVNLAAYDAEYKDLQTRNFDPVSGNIISGNAAKARARGIESDFDLMPTNWLSLGGSYSYTDARYRSYVDTSSSPPVINSGHRIPFTPKSSLNLRGEVHFISAGLGTFRFGGDVTYKSSVQFNDANNAPKFIVDRSRFRGLLNLRATFETPDRGLEINLFAKNATDTRSVITSADLSNFYDTFSEYNAGNKVFIVNYTDARVVGVSLTKRF